MKATGVVRKIDDLGRLVIPAEIRMTMNWSTHTPMEFYVKDDSVIIREYQSSLIKDKLVEELEELLKFYSEPDLRYIVNKTINYLENKK